MKRILVPLTTMAFIAMLSACGFEKTPVASTAETEMSETVKTETETKAGSETTELRGESVLKEALRQRLGNCIGIKGTSGASLKTIHQAVHFLQLANDGDYSLNIVSPVVLEFFDSLSDEDKAGFLETWDGIERYTDAILYDFNSVSSMLENAGDLDSAKKLANTAAVKEKWERMRKGIDAVLPEMIIETGEGGDETEVESGNEIESETETVFETDKYGYHILGTDENGTTIYATDRNGNLIGDNPEENLVIDEYGRVIRLPKANNAESEVETAETEEIPAFPEVPVQEEKQKETDQVPETETAVFPQTPIGYPTGGPGAVALP
ncbi:hypothetical protein UYO_0712 [Lachnospiraceae bacterium JC7]|nr:hypothetical protein UYO_0712 [Lachnospiraceae bacterium JC7]